jgi:hypothetical protein
MLKRQVVSLFHSLKSKGIRHYWAPSKHDEFNKTFVINQNYNMSKELKELIEKQNVYIININNQLTTQKKVIENIYINLEKMEQHAYGLECLQVITLFSMGFLLFKR